MLIRFWNENKFLNKKISWYYLFLIPLTIVNIFSLINGLEIMRMNCNRPITRTQTDMLLQLGYHIGSLYEDSTGQKILLQVQEDTYNSLITHHRKINNISWWTNFTNND